MPEVVRPLGIRPIGTGPCEAFSRTRVYGFRCRTTQGPLRSARRAGVTQRRPGRGLRRRNRASRSSQLLELKRTTSLAVSLSRARSVRLRRYNRPRPRFMHQPGRPLPPSPDRAGRSPAARRPQLYDTHRSLTRVLNDGPPLHMSRRSRGCAYRMHRRPRGRVHTDSQGNFPCDTQAKPLSPSSRSL
jgi:hypothetical protein